MNTTLATTPGRRDHPPQPKTRPERPEPERPEPERPESERRESAHRRRRVGPIDRLALSLGVALIRWGRRTAAPRRPSSELDRESLYLAGEERERALERHRVAVLLYGLTNPYR